MSEEGWRWVEELAAFIEKVTDSPIEGSMAMALVVEAVRAGYPGMILRRGDKHRVLGRPEVPVLLVTFQEKLGRYRADMVASEAWHPERLGENLVPAAIIECDGHDFHERTKAQARRDRARDRWFAAHPGFVVMRFTGSEIHRDAGACAREVLEALKARRRAS